MRTVCIRVRNFRTGEALRVSLVQSPESHTFAMRTPTGVHVRHLRYTEKEVPQPCLRRSGGPFQKNDVLAKSYQGEESAACIRWRRCPKDREWHPNIKVGVSWMVVGKHSDRRGWERRQNLYHKGLP